MTIQTTYSPVKKLFKRVKRGIKHQGITLIEIMVGMTIALLTLTGVLLNVSTATQTGSLHQNLSRMMENGQLALNVLTKTIHNAGYLDFVAVPGPGVARVSFGPDIFGCKNSSIKSTAADVAATEYWGVNFCETGGSSDAIAVRAQGEMFAQTPSLLTGSVEMKALDAAGSVLPSALNEFDRGDGKKVQIVDNRFYIDNNALMYRGNGGGSPLTAVALVQNIEQMRLWYGMAEPTKDINTGLLQAGTTTRRYMTADQIATTFASEVNPYTRVSAVRICIIVRSATPVAADTHVYSGCDGALVTPSDQFLRRAMFTTVDVANVGTGF